MDKEIKPKSWLIKHILSYLSKREKSSYRVYDQGQMDAYIEALEARSERLLVLAAKHCPREHHDWQEIMQIDEPNKEGE